MGRRFRRNPLWGPFGRGIALVVAAVALVVIVFGARPTLEGLVGGLPLLPLALLFAAMNSFGEDFGYRAAPLSVLLPAVGVRQSLLLTAVFFGLYHFYGTPPGVVGVLESCVLGWILAKSMVETRGFLWAWLIQWPPDIMVFAIALFPASG